jgi:hypothetical protein
MLLDSIFHGNQRHNTGDLLEHRTVSSVRLPTEGMSYLQTQIIQLTKKLASWSKVLPERVIVDNLVNKCPDCYET